MNDTISHSINSLMQNAGAGTATATSGDLQQQDLINKALVSAGLPQNKLNAILAQTKDKLLCNPDCQKQRQGNAYKQKWDLAKKNYKAAPEEIKQAEKNYYIFDKGYGAYKDMLYDRYTKSAAEFKAASNKKHAIVETEIQELLANYTAGTTYLKRMNEFLKIKLQEKEDLQHDIDAYIGYTETSGRKVIYENRERDSLTTYRQVITYLFLLIVLLFLVFGPFLPNKLYKQWRVWLILALFLLLPYFLIDRVVKLIFSLYNYLATWQVRKNVYE